MPGGQPCKFDRVQIGKDFVEYVKNNPDCFTVPQFSTSIGLSSDTLITWSNENEEFRQYYKLAKELIGINRLKAANNCGKEDATLKMEKSTYLRGLANFDLDQRHYERDEKKFDSSLKKDEAGQKQTNFTFIVPHGLAAGLNLPSQTISDTVNTSSE